MIYLDVDIVLFQDFSKIFGRIEPGKTELSSPARAMSMFITRAALNIDFLRDAMLFNDGFFATSRNVLSLQDFYDVIEADEKIFHAVRQRGGLFAQPLTNFVVHRRGLQIASLPDCIARRIRPELLQSGRYYLEPDGPRDPAGRQALFLSLARHYRHAGTAPNRRPLA